MTGKKLEKPLVVLIHGLRGSHHGLEAVAKNLAVDFEVLTPDLPGSGERAELQNKELAGYVEWLHEYCSRLGRKPFVVGHSMGSILVSHFVEKYPEDVERKMVLLAPILRTKRGAWSGKALYCAMRVALFPFSPKAKHKILASRKVSYVVSHYLTYDKSKQKEIDELHYKYGGRFASAESLLADAKISMMQTVVVPEEKDVLLVMGAHDKLTKLELGQILEEEAGVECQKMKGVGHLLNYEKPGEVAATIRDFLL